LELKNRIFNWLSELKEKGIPVEVIGFYQELPVRVKTKLLDFDENFLQWEYNPKLYLTASDDGKFFFYFNDPLYREKRLLGADVTYYGNSFIETTFPKPFSDPRFGRQVVRVTTSEKLPVKFFLLSESGKRVGLPVRDISEEGVGVIGEKGFLKLGEPIKSEIILPKGALLLEGKVVSSEPMGDKNRFGIKFSIREREKKLLRDYVMARQKEILSKIRDLVE